MNDVDLSGARAVVTGGAGFLGSHLCDRLLGAGAGVVAIDNMITGREANLDHLVRHDRFTFVKYDVTNYLHVPGEVDYILHFASPASPVDYLELPIQTLKVGALGTHKALGLARAKDATFMLASTSEVYGDPEVNPQPETYWGNVNPIGPRGVYDEAKRFAEAMTYAYHRYHDVDVRVARIFNSILADEQVLFDDGRQLRREKVQDLASRIGTNVDLADYEVPAFDEAGKIQSSGTIALVGHPTDAACYEVRTRYGRSIRVTGDHSLFVEGSDGTPVARTVDELEIGDRIAIAGRIEVPERDRRSVRISDAWDELGLDPWDLMILAPGLGDRVWERRQELLPRIALWRDVPVHGRTRQSLWKYLVRWRDCDYAPLGALRALSLDIPGDAVVRPNSSGRTGRMPLEFDVADDLLWFLGLFVAEGTSHEKAGSAAFVTISCDDEVLDRAEQVVSRLFGLHVVRVAGSMERGPAMFVHSVLLLRVLEHLGFTRPQPAIPGWVLGLPLPRLKWFLEGYREGDGVHSGAKFAMGKRHEFSTISTDLKDDLVVAFARFGLVPSVGRYETELRKRTGDRKYPFWRVTLANVRPWSMLEWDAGVEQALNARRTGDLVWARVNEIEPVESTELVYDFCVPGRENFWAGTGVMAHNTYGERMRPDDGRAVPTFIQQALAGDPLTVHGDGSQTRSLCYVEDEVEGLIRLLASDYTDPVNIGNAGEVTVRELAETVIEVAGSDSEITVTPRPQDDPEVRRPDTTVAESELGWKASVPLREGLERTIGWFRRMF